jgi:hypothetical protein
MRPTQREIMVLVAQTMQEDEEFYECLIEDLFSLHVVFLHLLSQSL